MQPRGEETAAEGSRRWGDTGKRDPGTELPSTPALQYKLLELGYLVQLAGITGVTHS